VIVLPAAAGGTTSNHLDLDVVAINPGPLSACQEDGSNCGLVNTVRHFLQVANSNPLPSRLEPSAPRRSVFPNAFVVDRIDETISVDGVETYNFFYTPPPDTNYTPYVGHWPATATCPPEGPPCNQVTNPAVMPGERTDIFWTGWLHGDAEPNGLYVFRYTVHGTLNGEPVEVSGSSPPIRMTD
jgi:hypothetical protein